MSLRRQRADECQGLLIMNVCSRPGSRQKSLVYHVVQRHDLECEKVRKLVGKKDPQFSKIPWCRNDKKKPSRDVGDPVFPGPP